MTGRKDSTNLKMITNTKTSGAWALAFVALDFLACAADPGAAALATTQLRVEVSAEDGALSVTDLRNQRVWRQVLLEKEPGGRQRVIDVDAFRNEITLECGLPGIRLDGRRGIVPARVHLRVPAGSPDVEMTVRPESSETWRQVSYPYVFARDGERLSNLFPHCEGMLVPARREHPDWIALPDGDFYGGVHAYLMCLGLVDEGSGEGLLTLLPDVEATLLKWRDVTVDGHTVVAPQLVCRANKGAFDRGWRATFCFSDKGGYVALAQRYRAFFAGMGLHKTLLEKAAENPAVHEILGAPVFWANTNTPARAAEMAGMFRAAGVDRCLFAMCNVPLHKPTEPDYENQMAEAIRQVRALGYHVYRYDQYRDAFKPDPAKGHSHQINTEAWPDKLVHRADGSRVAAFGPESGVVCAKFFMPLALANFDREFRDFAYSARFVDCVGSVGFNSEAECFDPAHPCDRYDTRRQRTALLEEVYRRRKLVSTECGIDYLLPHLHWVEGTTTLVRWSEYFPVKQAKENPGINDATGGRQSERMAMIRKLAPGVPAEQTVSISARYRVPFYSLCHHDEVMTTWRWEDGMDDPPVYWRTKNLWSVLSGSVPMYRTTAERIKKYAKEITATQRYVSEWARKVAFDSMLSHQFLTADRLVQESEFSSGRGVVVNFGDVAFPVRGGPHVKAGEYVSFTVQNGKRSWEVPACANVFGDPTSGQ